MINDIDLDVKSLKIPEDEGIIYLRGHDDGQTIVVEGGKGKLVQMLENCEVLHKSIIEAAERIKTEKDETRKD